MTDRRRSSRRQLLAASGTALSVAVAGCASSSDDGGSTDDKWQQPLDPDDWEDVDEIRLEGWTKGWAGVAPDLIEGIQNPVLLLFAGNDYEITWENGDGGTHNIAVRNEAGNAVRRTNNMRDRGETQTLKFTAGDELVDYVCEPHPRNMRGLIRIEE